MKKYSFLVMICFMFVSVTCLGQTKKSATRQRVSASAQKNSAAKSSIVQSSQLTSKPEVSLNGHFDLLLTYGDGQIPIKKGIKAEYLFEVYSDPSDRTAPKRKTAFIKLDVDWKAIAGEDQDLVCWSWSGKDVVVVKQEKGYALMSGNSNVLNIGFVQTKEGKKTWIQLNKAGMSGLYPGMFVDDLARIVQSEVPGTRVVVTGKVKDGLTEYVLLSFGENKVYDVTGDYHYEMNNREPYFTFWFDKNNKLVKWFKLK